MKTGQYAIDPVRVNVLVAVLATAAIRIHVELLAVARSVAVGEMLVYHRNHRVGVFRIVALPVEVVVIDLISFVGDTKEERTCPNQSKLLSHAILVQT